MNFINFYIIFIYIIYINYLWCWIYILIVIKPNVIKKANGSAYYEAENIKIICGV